MKKKYNMDKELLEFLYIECRLNSPEISNMLKCSKSYIISCLTKFSIPKRTSRESNIGVHRSEESKQNMSKAHKGKPLSESHKKAILKGKEGKPNPFKGKHHTEETKQILREKNSGINNHNFGKHFSEEHKRKIAISNTGWKHTEESKKKDVRST